MGITGLKIDTSGIQLAQKEFDDFIKHINQSLNKPFDLNININQITQQMEQVNKAITEVKSNLNGLEKHSTSNKSLVNSSEILKEAQKVTGTIDEIKQKISELQGVKDVKIQIQGNGIEQETQNIQKFIATIKTAEGEIQKLNYEKSSVISGEDGRISPSSYSISKTQPINSIIDNSIATSLKMEQEAEKEIDKQIKEFTSELEKQLTILNKLQEGFHNLQIEPNKKEGTITGLQSEIQNSIKTLNNGELISAESIDKIKEGIASLGRSYEVVNQKDIKAVQERKTFYDELINKQKELNNTILQSTNSKIGEQEKIILDEKIAKLQEELSLQKQIFNSKYYNKDVSGELKEVKSDFNENYEQKLANLSDKINTFSINSTEKITKLQQKFGEIINTPEINAKIEELQSRINTLKINPTSEGFNKLENDFKSLTAEMNNLGSVDKSSQKIKTFTNNMRTDIDRLKIKYKELVPTSEVAEIESLMVRLRNSENKSANDISKDCDTIKSKYEQMVTGIKASNTQSGQKDAKGIFSAFATDMVKFSIWQSVATAFMQSVNQVKSSIEYLNQLNTSQVNISMVTDMQMSKVEQLTDSYSKLAKQLGENNEEMNKGAETYLRAGLNNQDTEEMLKQNTIASKLSGVGSEEMSNYLISIKNGFHLETQEISQVVDALSTLDNKSSTSFQDISEAMQRSSASANQVGISWKTLASYVSVVSDVTHKSAETIGESYRSIFQRLTNVKAGVNTEDATTVNDVEKVLSKQNIKLRETNGQWRNMRDTIADIANKWKNMSSVDQSQVSTVVAGQRQAETFLTLMQNWSKEQQYEKDTLSSQGSSWEKYQTYLQSTSAKINNLQTELHTMYSSMMSSSFINGTITGLTKLISTFGNLKSIIAIIATTVLAFKGNDILNFFKALPINISSSISSLNVFKVAIGAMELQEAGLITKTEVVSLSFKALGLSIKEAFLSNPLGIIALGMTTVIGAIDIHNQKVEEAKQKQEELANSLAQSTSEMKSAEQECNNANELLKEQQDILAKGKDKQTVEDKQKLHDIEAQLAEIVPDATTAYDSENKALATNLTLTEQLVKMKKQDALDKAGKVISDTDVNDIMNKAQKIKSALELISKLKNQNANHNIDDKINSTDFGNYADLYNNSKYSGLLSKKQAEAISNAKTWGDMNKALTGTFSDLDTQQQSNLKSLNNYNTSVDFYNENTGKKQFETVNTNSLGLASNTDATKSNTKGIQSNSNSTNENTSTKNNNSSATDTNTQSTNSNARSQDELTKAYDTSANKIADYNSILKELDENHHLSQASIKLITEKYQDLVPYLNNTDVLHKKLAEDVAKEANIEKGVYAETLAKQINGLQTLTNVEITADKNHATFELNKTKYTYLGALQRIAMYKAEMSALGALESQAESAMNSSQTQEEWQLNAHRKLAYNDQESSIGSGIAELQKAVNLINSVYSQGSAFDRANNYSTSSGSSSKNSGSGSKSSTSSIDTFKLDKYSNTMAVLNNTLEKINAQLEKSTVHTKEYDSLISQKGKVLQQQYNLTKAQIALDEKAMKSAKASKSTKVVSSGATISSSSGNNSYANALQYAMNNYLGKVRYVFGARNPKKGTVDCSGLVDSIISQAMGKSQGYIDDTAAELYQRGKSVSKNNLQKGDVVFFNGYKGKGGVGHTGIYMGNGQFLEANSSKKIVKLSSLSSRDDYVGAKRILSPAGGSSSLIATGNSLSNDDQQTAYNNYIQHSKDLIEIEQKISENLKTHYDSYINYYDSQAKAHETEMNKWKTIAEISGNDEVAKYNALKKSEDEAFASVASHYAKLKNYKDALANKKLTGSQRQELLDAQKEENSATFTSLKTLQDAQKESYDAQVTSLNSKLEKEKKLLETEKEIISITDKDNSTAILQKQSQIYDVDKAELENKKKVLESNNARIKLEETKLEKMKKGSVEATRQLQIIAGLKNIQSEYNDEIETGNEDLRKEQADLQQSIKDTISQDLSNAESLQSKIVDALKVKYQELEDAELKANKELYESEVKGQEGLITQLKNQLKSLDDDLPDKQKNLAIMQKELAEWQKQSDNPYARSKIKELNEKISAQQKEITKDTLNNQIEALEKEQQTKEDNIKKLYEDSKTGLMSEKSLLEEAYRMVTNSMSNASTDIYNLLVTYTPKYGDLGALAGKSFASEFKKEIDNGINNLNDSIALSQGKLLPKDSLAENTSNTTTNPNSSNTNTSTTTPIKKSLIDQAEVGDSIIGNKIYKNSFVANTKNSKELAKIIKNAKGKVYVRRMGDKFVDLSSNKVYTAEALKKILKFNTGGYTGNGEGMAWLDKKEIVLKDVDTSNLLKTVKLNNDFLKYLPNVSFKMPDLSKLMRQPSQQLIPEGLVKQEFNITNNTPFEVKDHAKDINRNIKNTLINSGVRPMLGF